MSAAVPLREALGREYRAALAEHLTRGGEAALERGYEVGRRAVAAGFGALTLLEVHGGALRPTLEAFPPAERAELAQRALVLLAEALSPFEMGFLGYKEANQTLRSLSEALAVKNDELSLARADAERDAASERAARLELQGLHEALKGAQARLVQSERLASVGQLAAGMAHEVNNPLSFVLNNNAVIARDVAGLRALLALYREADGPIAAERPELHGRIRELTERLDLDATIAGLDRMLDRSRVGLQRIQKVVADLRDFVRLDDDALQAADLNEGVAATLDMVRGRAAGRGVALRADCTPLPLVTCLPAKINQALLNLVVNAIDACAPGGRVVVSTRPAPEGVRIDVVDDGVGIDPAILGRVFDPFFTTRPPGQGTGLGLSTSYGIVHEHGGRIEVSSTPGLGARFTILLPTRPPRGVVGA